MFQFPRFPATGLWIQPGLNPIACASETGFPIRTSPDRSLHTAPRGLSQCSTSFIGTWRQGIHRTPLVAYSRDAEISAFFHSYSVVKVPGPCSRLGPVGLAAGESPPCLTASPRPPSFPQRQIDPAHRRASIGEGACCLPTQLNPLSSLSIPSLLLRPRWR
jgi:hypothetical protein